MLTLYLKINTNVPNENHGTQLIADNKTDKLKMNNNKLDPTEIYQASSYNARS